MSNQAQAQMKTHKTVATLLLFLLPINTIRTQESFGARYNIAYITMENGLLHNYIDDIFKDSRGFLWMSTAGGGLARYDGYEFVNYTTGTSRVKMRSNFIRNSCEDNFSRLWISSEGGIDILDLNSNQLVVPQHTGSYFEEITGNPTINIAKDTRGNIWICTAGSIHKVVFLPDGSVSGIYTLSLSPIPLRTLYVATGDFDEDGNIWIGLGNRICKLTQSGNDKLKATLISPLLELEQGAHVTSLAIKENEIWAGTFQGLIRYNRNENMLKQYVYEKNNPGAISQNHVTDVAITADKQLLVSTYLGLNIYNPLTDGFDHLSQNEDYGANRLNSDFINNILIDGDIIWLGTESGGINKITPGRLSVRKYTHDKDNPHSLSKNIINAIYEDSNRQLWVGTVEGGLNRKVKGKEQFVRLTTEAPVFLGHNSVSAITEDEDKRLWVGTWGNGVSVIDLNHPERPAIKHINSHVAGKMENDFVGAIHYDPINKGVWIGTNFRLYFYDQRTGELITPIPADWDVSGAIGSVIDKNNRLWIGSMNGAYVIDLKSRRGNDFDYKYHKYKLDEPESGFIERISCFYLTSDSTLWIGSNGYGFYKYEEAESGEGKFTLYDSSHGLINNNVRGILEDDGGHLWISTNNGLSRMNRETGFFTNYTQKDGLVSNQFYWNAFCRTADGKLYFGSIDGLTVIEGIRGTPDRMPSRVTLTRLSVANEPILPGQGYIGQDISVAETLKLHEKDKSFSLEFSSLNHDQPDMALYSYRLLGFDDQWVEVPASRRFASYTNIPPGKYTFQVKYLYEVGNDNGIIRELDIVVVPFFYKTPWFIMLMVSLVLIAVLYLYGNRIRALKRQGEKLHRKVEERTRELNRQKLLLEEQTHELSLRNEMLVIQNEKITRQKTQLIAMSKKVRELTVDKIAFFTNITHEFRTPITLIIGPIERALRLSYNPQVIEQLNFVERNSKYLLSLVNQLMDFRKVESGKMKIVKRPGDFPQFVNALLIPFEVFAGERKISVRKFIRLGEPVFLFDQDAMQKVIANLLSNAIKFTPDGGEVSVYISSYRNKAGGEVLYIGIRDTGPGIVREDLLRVFDRFYQSRDSVKYPVYGQSGTGIGLYLCKRIVQMHEGSIQAKNNRGKGSSFRVFLPIQREEKQVETALRTPVSAGASEGAPGDLAKHIARRKPTVLIVEDNRDMRGFIRSILSEQYHILEAENGQGALNILSVSNVDFIVSDLMMPVMDGLEFSREVKGNFATSHIPFLMLTAKTSQESEIESYRMGVDAFLSKPFNEELLLARIKNIMSNRKRYQQQFASSMDIEALRMDEESGDGKFLNKALGIIKDNYKNSYYEVPDFIRAMGVSKSMLNKKLQHLAGQSAGQFIRNYRLNLARELIERNKTTRNMNISEIAYEVGFNDPKYFTRCFTRKFKVTPSSLLE